MEGGGENFPWAGEVHEIELRVEDEENVEGFVLIHHRRSLMRTHLAGCKL